MPGHTKHPLKRALLPVLLALPVVAGSLWLLQATPEENARTVTQAAAADTTNEPTSQKPAAPVPSSSGAQEEATAYRTPASLGPDPFAPSLEGTDIDGQLRADANGELIVELATRDFFDYFLNTIGEVPAEQALAQIEALARGSLPETAAKQAMALLDQYLQYKNDMVALGSRGLDPSRQHDPGYQLETLKTALADIKALRRQSFSGETHQAFFGLEEAYGDYTLASLDIQQRRDLSDEAKADLQNWHRQQLPEVIRRTENRLVNEGEQHRQAQQAIADAQSAEDAGKRLRALGVDSARINEVVSYMEERERFDQQFQRFQKAASNLDTTGLARDDAAALETRLLEEHFEDEKTRTWARLRALEVSSP